MNIDCKDTPLVLLCPAWQNWGDATTVKPNTIILHSRQDDVIPFADSEELVANSGLPPNKLIEVGDDHRLTDPEPLEAMLDACFNACLPKWNDQQVELLQQEWDGLCYTAAMRWITATKDSGWHVVHGTVFSGELEKRIEHAWCERSDVIVDLAMHPKVRVIDRHTYYRTIQPEVSRVYPAEDALLLSNNVKALQWIVCGRLLKHSCTVRQRLMETHENGREAESVGHSPLKQVSVVNTRCVEEGSGIESQRLDC